MEGDSLVSDPCVPPVVHNDLNARLSSEGVEVDSAASSEGRLKNRIVIGTLVAVLVGATVATLVFNKEISSVLIEGLDKVDGMGIWKYFIVAFMGLLPSVPVPALYTIVTFCSGILFGIPLGYAVVLPGLWGGMVLCFIISRSCLSRYVKPKLAQYPNFSVALYNNSLKMVVMVRLTPVPYGWQHMLWSVTDVSLRTYVLGSSMIVIPQVFLFCYIGTTIKSLAELSHKGQSSSPTQTGLLIGGCAAFFLAMTFLTWKVRKEMRRIQREQPLLPINSTPRPASARSIPNGEVLGDADL